MAILRKTIQREIKDLLDSSFFTSDDFEYIFGNSEKDEYIISIIFIHDKTYNYNVSKSLGKNEFIVIRKPGEIEDIQAYICKDLSESISGILEWCHEVRNELKATKPTYSEIESLKKLIYEQIKGTDEENGEFSVKEINELRKKFQDLEKRVEDLEKENIITKSQLEEFKTGISQISEDLEFYPKETWIKTATNKIGKLVISIGKSKEGRAILAEGAKKLLGL